MFAPVPPPDPPSMATFLVTLLVYFCYNAINKLNSCARIITMQFNFNLSQLSTPIFEAHMNKQKCEALPSYLSAVYKHFKHEYLSDTKLILFKFQS